MKQIILLGLLVSMVVGCTKYNSIDTGLAQKKYSGNMYEYFHSNTYDWDSLLVLVDYMGLEEYFTGEKEGYETVTFFGPPIIPFVDGCILSNHIMIWGLSRINIIP